MAGPSVDFWQQRFEANDIPWDRGAVSPQLAPWLADGTLAAGQRVAVPGCGSGHEVLALVQAGCQVTAIDYAPAAVARTAQRLRDAGLGDGACALVQADVLQWQPAEPLDAVFEQTCWCAIHPGGRLCLMGMQVLRPGAAIGRIEGPPYHLDIHLLRALLPAGRWHWPAPPYEAVPHPRGWRELAISLIRD